MMTGSDLPDDIDVLKAMILASQAQVARQDELVADQDAVIERKEDCIQRLEKLVADFKRALFGARSEQTDPEQFELALEDIETAMAVVQTMGWLGPAGRGLYLCARTIRSICR